MDDVIFSSGMTATAMYFLKKGSFSYTTYFDMENFPDIGEKGEMGPFLGEMTLLTKYPWMHQGMLRATRMGTTTMFFSNFYSNFWLIFGKL